MNSNSEIKNIIYDFNHGKFKSAFSQISDLIKKTQSLIDWVFL